jgi:hypothetical protein
LIEKQDFSREGKSYQKEKQHFVRTKTAKTEKQIYTKNDAYWSAKENWFNFLSEREDGRLKIVVLKFLRSTLCYLLQFI